MELWGVTVSWRGSREFRWLRSAAGNWTDKPSEALCFHSRQEAEALAILRALDDAATAQPPTYSAERLDVYSG